VQDYIRRGFHREGGGCGAERCSQHWALRSLPTGSVLSTCVIEIAWRSRFEVLSHD